jgi:2-amino-4-hydroxy-6-hydroxymethyldihydropteridine diphosphokinase
MAKAYLGLGSNLGDREENLHLALRRTEEQVGSISALSAFYVTEPWGFASEHTFVNAVACVETALTPHRLLAVTQGIEQEMGRKEKTLSRAYTDRTIDIDLLMMDDLVMDEPGLVLPHPLMHIRRFVLEPFDEIAPLVRHPILGKTVRELYLYICDKPESDKI